MRLLHSLLPVLLFGCTTTVSGEGEDARAHVQRLLNQTSSDGALFECAIESGTWPTRPGSTTLSLSRHGVWIVGDGQTLALERVDESATANGRVSYVLVAGAVSVVLTGAAVATGWTPVTAHYYGATSYSAVCRRGTGVFDDRELDELVTSTNGYR